MSKDEAENIQRIHNVTWDDPKCNVRTAQALSGLDYLRSIKLGKISPPPVARLVNYKITEIRKGFAVFELEPAEYHQNPFGTVHGGIISTLLDTTMTAAVLSTLPVGVSCSTMEIKVNFIRPVTGDAGLIHCKGKTIHVGDRVATAEGRVVDGEGTLYAHGLTTCMVIQFATKA